MRINSRLRKEWMTLKSARIEIYQRSDARVQMTDLALASALQRKLWMVIHDDVRKSPSVRRAADVLNELLHRPAR